MATSDTSASPPPFTDFNYYGFLSFSEKPNLKIAPPPSFSLISDAQKQLRFRRPSVQFLRPFVASGYLNSLPMEKREAATRRFRLFACRLLRLCPSVRRVVSFGEKLAAEKLLSSSSLNGKLTFWPFLFYTTGIG